MIKPNTGRVMPRGDVDGILEPRDPRQPAHVGQLAGIDTGKGLDLGFQQGRCVPATSRQFLARLVAFLAHLGQVLQHIL